MQARVTFFSSVALTGIGEKISNSTVGGTATKIVYIQRRRKKQIIEEFTLDIQNDVIIRFLRSHAVLAETAVVTGIFPIDVFDDKW